MAFALQWAPVRRAGPSASQPSSARCAHRCQVYPVCELSACNRRDAVSDVLTHSVNSQVQCSSAYCHYGSCDVKKPNGHVCYKDAGCTSGNCSNKKCVSQHSSSGQPARISTTSQWSANHGSTTSKLPSTSSSSQACKPTSTTSQSTTTSASSPAATPSKGVFAYSLNAKQTKIG